MFKKPRISFLLAILAIVTCATAQAECGAEERAAFLAAANSGVPAEELIELYGHCKKPSTTKTITINNGLASTFYEQMNGCGYHPQIGVAACDVEIKQTFGFGAFGAAPLGSTEFVTFCFSCGGGVIPVLATVHVTDDISGAAPSWGMLAIAAAPPACPLPGGTGTSFPIRATLSWGVPAVAPCTAAPGMIWGNQINFDTRDDP